ncbi:type II toxin-antitoxin system RelE/ParE family toxin [Paramagnetospirillum kuznetsovii]|uniref:type II toxin-antitoxin system RelE/ParE family toxin n=1 Tax=Paramagnetospirillum kuznetsovii TaxID=2053833 RepID=UPI0013750F8F|nr:type II toxin-antitoxin system RelE/ParE family toxin [Paramagnetospirillum kuznetsovii]
MLSWADSALDDLHLIRAGLATEAAARVGRIIAEASDVLTEFPDRGRVGKVPDTRELPLPGLPWRLVYRIGGKGRLTVLRVLA